MAHRDARVRDLQRQPIQLDIQARGCALTPGEAEKYRNRREALLREPSDIESAAVPGAPTAAGTSKSK